MSIVHYFSGSSICKLDNKNRFVLPVNMRNGLVDKGELKFALGIGLGGCLAIYPSSLLEKIVSNLRSMIYSSQHQQFFTLFFSTLHKSSCDTIGRVYIPALLKKAANLSFEIIVAGVMDKIEIWPKESYENYLQQAMQPGDLQQISRQGFALLHEEIVKNRATQEALV